MRQSLNRRFGVGGFVLLIVCAMARAGEVTEGALLSAGPEGAGEEFPLKHTDVRAEITGNVARVLLTQTFQNPYDRKIEALYVFPLPDRAAVDDMEIAVEGLTIRGVIRKKEEARALYEGARRAGQVAGLLDQERPNVFTQSVANILPGSEVMVTIRYFETLPYDSGTYAFTFPMVVGPRFDSPDAGAVPDASRLAPPIVEPGRRPGRDIALQATIEGGAPVRDLASPSHGVEVESRGPTRVLVRLKPEDSIPNKDFVLRYRIDGPEPSLVVLPHRAEGDGHFLLILQPEAAPTREKITPKEMIFVVDCSGSMRGSPIEKVKEAMRYALAGLDPLDTFQIIRFSNQARTFADEPVLATAAHVDDALRYVERLSGEGGTILIDGVRTALGYPEDPQRLRIVSFMTDGDIGDEEAILRYLSGHLGGARLFSFGAGSSPNRYLLDRMAEFGRGAVDYIPPSTSAESSVDKFYDRIRSPYLTDIALDWGDLKVEDLYPRALPDLFLGHPIVQYGRYSRPGAGELTIRGRLGGRPYERRFHVELPERREEGGAISTLWARARIEDLSSDQIRDPAPDRVEEITEVALAYRLVSAYTSFVAVAESTRTGPEEPETVPVPVPLPEGMDPEGTIGGPRSAELRESIQVTARSDVVTTETSFSSGFIDSLPTLGRNYQDVLVLSPGVTDIHGSRDTDVIKRKANPPVPASCRLTAPRRSYRLGESIEIAVTIENRSDEAIDVPTRLSIADGTARIILTNESGAVLPDPTDHSVAVGTVPLEPGASLVLRFIINGPGGYRLDRAGTYRIVLLGTSFGMADSNILTLRVRS